MSIRVCAGRFRSIRLECPSEFVRPTTDRVKEAIFSTLVHDLKDSVVLDLFAGSGSLGIEAISRGAMKVTFVDKSRECIKVVEKNIKTIGAQEQSIIIRSDALTFINKCTASFDLIFMDPPYHKGLASQLAPHVYNFLKIEGILVVEHSSREEIPMAAWKTRRYGDTSISYFIRTAQ